VVFLTLAVGCIGSITSIFEKQTLSAAKFLYYSNLQVLLSSCKFKFLIDYMNNFCFDTGSAYSVT